MKRMVELVVIGAGPAGITAAVTAARNGVDVCLIDAYATPGGQYYKQLPGEFLADGRSDGMAFVEKLDDEKIDYRAGTLVWGVFEAQDDVWCINTQKGDVAGRIFTKNVILATGAYDRPLAFPGWTLPGVMTAGAVLTMIKNQCMLPGKRFLLSGSGPLQLAVAAHLVQAGAEVSAVLEAAPGLLRRGIKHIPALLGHRHKMMEGFSYWKTLRGARVPVFFRRSVVEARGDDEVRQAVTARLDEDWKPVPGSEQVFEVDTVVTGFGLLPATELSRLLECEHRFDAQAGCFLPERNHETMTSIPGIYAVGDCAAICGVDMALLEGELAAVCVARDTEHLACYTANMCIEQLQARRKRELKFAAMLDNLFTPAGGIYTLPGPDTILCRCEQVSLQDVLDAVSFGAESLAEIKNLSRCGMGSCQGRVCEDVISRIIASARDVPLAGVGYYRKRPPIHPLTVSQLSKAVQHHEDY